MKITATNGRFSRQIHLPTDSFNIRDELDKLRADGDTQLDIEILYCSDVEILEGKRFRTDLYKMNFLAERIDGNDMRHNVLLAAMLTANQDRSVDELIQMTYSDSMPISSCGGYRELGEKVIDNKLLPELENIPNSLLPMLDREYIGKMYAQQVGGVFVERNYCLTSEYIEPKIDVKIVKSQDVFFSLTLVPCGKDPDQYGQRFKLPCSMETLEQFASDCGEPLDRMNYLHLRTSVPLMYDPQNVAALNDLAVRLAALSKDEFIKLKAVMQTLPTMNIRQTNELVTQLDEYEFDRQIKTFDDYAHSYLDKFLPPEFSPRVFEDTDLTKIGNEILLYKKGQITTYGVISGRGEQLYTPIVDKPMNETEDEVEDESEVISMGGMA